MRRRVSELRFGVEVLGCDLAGRFAVQHALAPGVVGRVEAASICSSARCEWTLMLSTSLLIRPLKRSVMPLVWGVRGRVCRCCAPGVVQALAKAGVKRLPLSVSAWVSWKGKAVAASRRKAVALCSVSALIRSAWRWCRWARLSGRSRRGQPGWCGRSGGCAAWVTLAPMRQSDVRTGGHTPQQPARPGPNNAPRP